MRIAFYAPMKPPDHPSPSGDRLMARQIVTVLERLGHQVEVVSRLVSRSHEPDAERLAVMRTEADVEVARLLQGSRPDLWLTYHLYHKAPDLIGPALADRWNLPYVVIEASYTPSKVGGAWGNWQAPVREALEKAATILTMTGRDRDGLLAAGFGDKLVDFPPFLLESPGASALSAPPDVCGRIRLLTVAMMRPGHKMESYRLLAAAAASLSPDRFALEIIGDGACRVEVEALFRASRLPVRFHGAGGADEIANAMARADIFVWPGIGEAYGMVYLEAQAAGLPVVALDQAGVPDAVPAGAGGVLVSRNTDASEADALAQAIVHLADDPGCRRALGETGKALVLRQRSAEAAARQLQRVLDRVTVSTPTPSRRKYGDSWLKVVATLDRLAAGGRTVDLWLRDDDAVADTPALRRLRALLEAHGIPVLLAVIPCGLEPSLIDLLRRSPVLVPCQHGIAHANRAIEGEKKAELVDHSDTAPMMADLGRAREALARDLPGFMPVMVPPWNRIAPAVRARLVEAGFPALSTFGRDVPDAEQITLRNTHIDLVDWRGGRAGKDSARVAKELLAELSIATAPDGDGRIGILMHHLAHDEVAWSTIEDLLAVARHHPAVRWPHPRQLFNLP